MNDMTYDILATKWNNRFSRMCPCNCSNVPPYASEYRITVKTKTMQGYGDPLVREVAVHCMECGRNGLYDVDDGYSRVSDYDIR